MYPSDYLSDTPLLSLEAHGMYFLLLQNLWLHDGELPADAKKLAKILRLDPRQVRRYLGHKLGGKSEGELSPYFEVSNGLVKNSRLSRELKQTTEKQNKLSEAGRKGNAKRWSPGDSPPESQNHRIPEPEPDINISTPNGVEPFCTTKGQCPHTAIIKIYHEELPDNPQVRKWTPTRQAQLRARWKEAKADLEGWRKFFQFCAQSKFLTGKTEGRNGTPPFVADLAWLTKAENYAKVLEGRYHR